jgi:hypothetical protein
VAHPSALIHHPTSHHGNVRSRPTDANDSKPRKESGKFGDALTPTRRRTLELAVGLRIGHHLRQG